MFPDSWNVCRRQMLIGDLAEVLWLFLNHYTQLHAETLLLLLISPPPTTPPHPVNNALTPISGTIVGHNV